MDEKRSNQRQFDKALRVKLILATSMRDEEPHTLTQKRVLRGSSGEWNRRDGTNLIA